MNKMDLMEDLEMAEMVEQEIRDLLTSYGFDGTFISHIFSSLGDTG